MLNEGCSSNQQPYQLYRVHYLEVGLLEEGLPALAVAALERQGVGPTLQVRHLAVDLEVLARGADGGTRLAPPRRQRGGRSGRGRSRPSGGGGGGSAGRRAEGMHVALEGWNTVMALVNGRLQMFSSNMAQLCH